MEEHIVGGQKLLVKFTVTDYNMLAMQILHMEEYLRNSVTDMSYLPPVVHTTINGVNFKLYSAFGPAIDESFIFIRGLQKNRDFDICTYHYDSHSAMLNNFNGFKQLITLLHDGQPGASIKI
jgi:hypothetical protein